jgi:AsmA protein
LMRGDVQVKHILVDTAAIDLQVDAQGVGNWTKLIKQKPAETSAANTAPGDASAPVDTKAPADTKAPSDTKAKELKLAIEKISLQHSQVSYSDLAKGSHFLLKDIELEMDGVNLDGEPFTMAFSSEAQISSTDVKAPPLIIKTKLDQKITLDKALSEVKISEGDLVLAISKNASATLKFKYAIKLGDLKNNLAYQGEFTSDTFNARELLAVFGSAPKTANEKALTDLKITAKINGDKTSASLKDIDLKLDKTSLKGALAITNFSTSAIEASLQGDDINLDDYLAPKVVESGVSSAPAPIAAAVTGDEILIPLELLRKLNVDIKAGFKKLQVMDLPLTDVQLDIAGSGGHLQQQLSASAYSGTLREKANMQAGQTAQVQFEAHLQGVEIAPLLKDRKLDKSLHLSGAMQLNARGQASGVTKNQILASLTGGADFAGAKVRLAPLNIEQQFCKLVDLVNRAEAQEQAWDAFTELRELTGKVAIANRIITIESLNAGVEKLLLAASGNINLEKGSYNVLLPLKLVRDASDTPTSITTSAKGCTVNSNYWAERSMSLLRCKGAYANIDPKNDCRPDSEMLRELTKDYAEYKLKEKHGAKIEAKKEELMKKLDEKLGGEGKAEKAKDLLKNIFKKKDDK